MEEDDMKELNYKEMQELLPDYVFGRLPDEEKINFEQLLPMYPDLVDEIKQVNAVFSRVEEMDLNKKIEYRTRNLSIKVQDRLSKSRQHSTSFNLIVRFAFPTLAIFAMAYILLTWNRPGQVINNPVAVKLEAANIFKPGEAESIIDSTMNIKTFSEISHSLYRNIDDGSDLAKLDNIHDDLDKYDTEFLAGDDNGLNDMPAIFLYEGPNNQNEINIDDFYNLNESDFQDIYEEIENENILG